ncbi:aminopeptidase [Paenisporosarcina antarctica]|uniref:Aminopeptidase n=1 Tax=Paenisporosarcina antarctica TaxID=417367 RepID=A0A4P6ZVL9_9BACL|nr:aminopeptidase [Paenisporosarcina antarctica]QBP40337.1 aminopeptidase [Paenisporosarcina antarctica]
MTFDEKLAEYANLAVRVGINVQPGQYVLINTTTETLDFTRLVVKKAYEAGAKRVHVNFSDGPTNRAFYEFAAESEMHEFPAWMVAQRDELIDQQGALLWIDAEDPDLLAGVPVKRISDQHKVAGRALEKYRAAVMSDKIAWSIVAIPSQKWAAKVFPELPKEEQLNTLWEVIFKTVRIGDGTAVEQWKTHISELEKRATALNDKRYKKIIYKAPGTELTIELPTRHLWMTGASKTPNKTAFIANMPTEEVYTAPLKLGVNGYVRNTKPLVYQGNIIDGFTFTFENGKIVKAQAEVGNDLLQGLIQNDNGSAYLGELALVPHKSPISSSGILFYNTLFDENASNHLAIGEAYPTCVEGASNLEEGQFQALGLNTSITHEDFMIGSAEMDIDGEREDGKIEPIFRQGNWAF